MLAQIHGLTTFWCAVHLSYYNINSGKVCYEFGSYKTETSIRFQVEIEEIVTKPTCRVKIELNYRVWNEEEMYEKMREIKPMDENDMNTKNMDIQIWYLIAWLQICLEHNKH